jgi:hypothetical protein
MNTAVRTIVVSAATVAVLGLAGTATAADLTTPAHHQAVAAVAATVRPVVDVDPATYTAPQQVTTQSASAGQLGVGGTAILLLGFGVWYAVKKENVRVGWMLCSFALGVLLAGGAIGAMTQNAVTSGVTTIATLGGTLS